MKYKTTHVTVEACQYFDDMGTYTIQVPMWFIEAFTNKTIYCVGKETFIKTSVGARRVFDGDWIIKEGSELYPCKPDIFEMAYKPLEGGKDG